MPLFGGNKFSPKKTTPRKTPSLSNLHLDSTQQQEEFGLDFGPIKVNLGGSEAVFEDGQWISDSSGGGGRDIIKMKKQNQQLIEENNLLKLKMDILLDMLAEATAETHLKETEIDQLKDLARRKR
ncbi:unnamed protein product [Owenia fusiformis]|uniref:Uncharacterized protein n=1 Tax=Owenia fusiformis TaxID=6347 RepID=A0A8J1UAV6_OWEFU|nr:unnamed protein product [Owenia fusiformis]